MNRGFTLIEFIVYIGIVGVVLLVAGAITLNIFYGKAKLTAVEEVSQNARFAVEKIAYTIRNAQAVDSPSVGVSAATLELEMLNNSIEFEADDDQIKMTESTGRGQDKIKTSFIITSDEVKITSLQFANLSYSDTPGTVRVQMTIEYNNPSGRQEREYSKTFYTTANVRKK